MLSNYQWEELSICNKTSCTGKDVLEITNISVRFWSACLYLSFFQQSVVKPKPHLGNFMFCFCRISLWTMTASALPLCLSRQVQCWYHWKYLASHTFFNANTFNVLLGFPRKKFLFQSKMIKKIQITKYLSQEIRSPCKYSAVSIEIPPDVLFLDRWGQPVLWLSLLHPLKPLSDGICLPGVSWFHSW